MPLQATSGAASYDAFGGGVAVVPTYIEDVFSTYVYSGNSGTFPVVNGIDLSTYGGMLWTKNRTSAYVGQIYNSSVGLTKYLVPSTTAANATTSGIAFNTNGFTLGSNDNSNSTGQNGVGWTFRKQPKFFDIVTWTGTGATGAISHSHSLGSTPGCIIIKAVSTNEGAWYVYHRSTGVGKVLILNTTDSAQNAASPDAWTVSSTQFSVNTSQLGANTNGTTYVAYLFAHDAGGFGLTGTDNVISCGSLTLDGSGNATVNLGYEPQWVMIKRTDNTSVWYMQDTMRGLDLTTWTRLLANTSAAESTSTPNYITPSSTGFNLINGFGTAGSDWIYIAIRRGPMKVPTLGTSVFATVARTGTGAAATVTAGFPVDMYLMQRRPNHFPNIVDRLRGNTKNIQTYQTDAETTITDTVTGLDNMTAALVGADTSGYVNESAVTYVNQMFRRAPSFMDVVCYTGDSSDPKTVSHNLGKAPELMIFKARAVAAGWRVWGGNMAITEYLALSETSAVVTGSTFFGSTLPTATSFYVGSGLNSSGRTHVAYLFSTATGVSKVFSYTGNGSSQTINCGFTGGARFILIKRTDSTGDWYVWDTARGIVAGNDPHLSLNTTAAEVTTDDTIDTDSTGFVVNQVSATNVNVSSANYIGLAIA
jgi:hypothetical protein